MGGEGKTKGFIEPKGSRASGGWGFSSLMKQKGKGKNCAVFCLPGKRFFFIYDVIVKQKNYKRSTNHYSCRCRSTGHLRQPVPLIRSLRP
jgi:hypothetical protein